jgi:uncharacterized integral membrane protein
MWVIRALLVVALVAIIVGFTVYNADERVSVNLFQTRYVNYPLIYVAYWAFLFGMLVSFVLSVTIYFKQAGEIRRYRRAAEGLSNEIAALRNRRIDEASDNFLQSNRGDS